MSGADDAKKAIEALKEANRGLVEVAERLDGVNAGLDAAIKICDERLPAIKAQVDAAKAMGEGFLDARPAVQEFLRMKGAASVRELDDEGMRELKEFLERKLSFARAKNDDRLD